ncbi:hypothetical protein [Asanoa siamensis]|uniref:Uncharacterized protein n=1 Tax=Asanoa siamensis TaxID=926357 RepID=A0ABQ4CMI8_9ACTN|nr:hypothetical protein [Asanoa siamensis]GIF72512.1 hypothetical protein Asi02nite_20300 [Asanoa siamensis]
MGVLCDYFRAADVSTVVTIMDVTDGGPVQREGYEQVVDCVDAKGIEPAVVLGRLVAFVRGESWYRGIAHSGFVWTDGDGGAGSPRCTIGCGTRWPG